jgi:hypothetical protein
MPRISSNSFAVNSSLQQEIELSSVKAGVTVPISSTGDLGVDLVKVGNAAIDLGQETSSGSIPVVLASDDTVNINIDQVGSVSVDLGQELSASSFPVVISSDQSTVAVTPATGDNAILSSIQEVGIFGHDSGGDYRRLNCSTAGNLKVESELEDHSGSQGNLENASSVVSGDVSTAVDTSNHTLLTLFGNTTDTSNGIIPQISADGTNYYPAGIEIYPDSNGDFYQNFPNITVNNFRIKFQGTATVTATLLHNNH